jgi:hypothetical protein
MKLTKLRRRTEFRLLIGNFTGKTLIVAGLAASRARSRSWARADARARACLLSGWLLEKTSLDRAIGNDTINGNTVHRIVGEVSSTLQIIERLFPNLRETRFRNSVEFYSLFLLIWEMSKEKFVLTDRKRNAIAFSMLRKLSTEVDQLREQLRKAKPGKVQQRLYQEYLLTVQGDTDSSATRDRRQATGDETC